MITRPSPIDLKTPGVMRARELAARAQVGKNTIPFLVKRFDLRTLSDHAKNRRYSVVEVARKILGVTPETLADHQGVTPQTSRNDGRAGRRHRIELTPRAVRYGSPFLCSENILGVFV